MVKERTAPLARLAEKEEGKKRNYAIENRYIFKSAIKLYLTVPFFALDIFNIDKSTLFRKGDFCYLYL